MSEAQKIEGGAAEAADDKTLLEYLVDRARVGQRRAYAPYSGFAVGAAVRTADGRVFLGANIENASYGLTVCAERNAVMQAVLAGGGADDQRGAARVAIVAVAVVTPVSPPAAPCGMCRQVIAEFAADDCVVVMANGGDERYQMRLSELLPAGFRRKDLLRAAEQRGPQET